MKVQLKNKRTLILRAKIRENKQCQGSKLRLNLFMSKSGLELIVSPQLFVV